jgi:hypothetical protein
VPSGWICTRNVTFDLSGGTGINQIKHTPSKPLREVKNEIQKILDQHRPTMQTLVTNAGREPLIPPWTPKTGSGGTVETVFRDHIKTLAIPAVRGLPSLLLHELGSETSVISKKQADYIDGIFTLNNHMCVDNYDSLFLVD